MLELDDMGHRYAHWRAKEERPMKYYISPALRELLAQEISQKSIEFRGDEIGRRWIWPGWDKGEGERLHRALTEDSNLPGWFWVGNSGGATTVDGYAQWLIERSTSVGPEQALQELHHFISSQRIPVIHYALTDGIYLDWKIDNFSFHNGFQISHINEHPDYMLRQAITRAGSYGLPFPRVQCFLHCNSEMPLSFDPDEHPRSTVDVRDFEALAACITLARPVDSAFQIFSVSHYFPDNIPKLENGRLWCGVFSSEPQLQGEVIEFELQRADEIYRNFLRCSPNLKTKIILATRLLSQVGSKRSHEETSISLRTALEITLITGRKSDGKQRKISERASKFLDHPSMTREQIRQEVSDVYGMLSTVAHRGEIEEGLTFQRERAVASHLRDIIVKIIEDGRSPDWSQL